MNKYQEALSKITRIFYLDSEYHKLLKELVEKATPKKPSMEWLDTGSLDVGKTEACPNCLYQGIYKEDDEYWFDGISYCRRCGQAIDWSSDD